MIVYVLTRKEIAEAIGISRQALNQWDREGAKVDDYLHLPLDEAVAWLKMWREDNKHPRYQQGDVQPNAGGSLQERLLAAQIRKNNADAESKEIKNRERRGELCETAEAEAQVAELVNMIRHRLESSPDEIVGELPVECRDVALERMKDKIYLILTEMSQWRLGE